MSRTRPHGSTIGARLNKGGAVRVTIRTEKGNGRMAGGGKRKRGGLSAQELRAFRSKVAKLKEKGIVSKRVDARSQSATKYMRSKVRKYTDVLEGTAVAVKAPKDVRTKYVEAGVFEARGSRLIVPKEHANSRVKISKGKYVQSSRIMPSPDGGPRVRETRTIMPTNMQSMSGIVDWLEQHGEELENDLVGDEQLAFRLFGHNSTKAFVDVHGPRELLAHIKQNYQHLLKETKAGNPNRQNKAGGQHFELLRYAGVQAGSIPRAPDSGKIYSTGRHDSKPGRRMDATGRNTGRRPDKFTRAWLDREHARKLERARDRRANESEAKREARLKANRERSRAWRTAQPKPVKPTKPKKGK